MDEAVASFTFEGSNRLASSQKSSYALECHCRAGLETTDAAAGSGALATFSADENQSTPCLSHCLTTTSDAMFTTAGVTRFSMCIALFHTGAARRNGIMVAVPGGYLRSLDGDDASRSNQRFGFSVAGLNRTDGFTPRLATGTWHHICGVYDGSTIDTYVNCNAQSCNPVNSLPVLPPNQNIGNDVIFFWFLLDNHCF